MGPYCDHCDQRCYVERTYTDGRRMYLATCAGGMARDFELLGLDHRGAVNPATGRPGYDTADYRRTAKRVSTLARYLAYGSENGTQPHQLVEELDLLVRDLRRQTPVPGVAPVGAVTGDAGE